MGKNVASGHDRVELQIGVINPPASSKSDHKPGNAKVENIREGNATVGRQTGHIEGDVRFF